MRHSVTFIQRILPHYRVPFFVGLQRELEGRGIKFRLLYGQEEPGTVPASQALSLPWAYQIKNRYIRMGSVKLVWQPCLKTARSGNLIIVEQASALLLNYVLMVGWRNGVDHKLAYYGHGRNMQAIDGGGLKEKWKRAIANHVDWWFAYTEITRQTVLADGYPEKRITLANNTVDTSELIEEMAKVTQEDLRDLRKKMGLVGARVGIYCGGMYSDKKLDFLINSALQIRDRVPDFNLICIGNGPEEHLIRNAANQYSWIHWVGPKYGTDRVPYFLIGELTLMPGLVGLAIVDSMTMGVPLFTTDNGLHSPEIAYLENGVNGVMTALNVHDYVDAIAKYLESPDMRSGLKEGCYRSSKRYTIDKMIQNFSDGIVSCLATDTQQCGR